ncbi:FadR/GntR family transcriptional regulator [Chitinophaga sp. Cy-1792]|uniref:FadR/GntR family transcriptional regulator n=1 Tax=Chitinophaga sp. Cy-1792 TaxID=2608339 RepID=UPI001F0490CA|nr:FadR/GntR family transcriptional regulator [Chitinophaga sp. Cy-1792]
MMNTVTPVKRLSLAEEVAGRIQDLIVSGKIVVDQQLPTEPELMAQYGVGRSSIREAIKILVNRGFLKVQQGLGTFIISQTGSGEPLTTLLQRADFEDLNEVRLILEVKIAEKAAMLRSQKDIDKMKGFLKKRYEYAIANNLEACIQADINFHKSIADAARNEVMIDLYASVADMLKKSFVLRYGTTKTFVDTQHLHDALLQAIIDKDPKKAWSCATRIMTHGT